MGIDDVALNKTIKFVCLQRKTCISLSDHEFARFGMYMFVECDDSQEGLHDSDANTDEDDHTDEDDDTDEDNDTDEDDDTDEENNEADDGSGMSLNVPVSITPGALQYEAVSKCLIVYECVFPVN